MTTDEQGHMVDEAQQQGATYQDADDGGATEAIPPPVKEGMFRWNYPGDSPWSYSEFSENANLQWAMQKFANQVAAYRRVMEQLAPQQQAQPQRQQPRPTTNQNRSQQPQGGARRPQQGQRDEYPPQGLVSTLNDDVNWTCDQCGGSARNVARREQKGQMDGDTIVCLNSKCKEGQFRRTIAWVEPGTTREQQRN